MGLLKATLARELTIRRNRFADLHQDSSPAPSDYLTPDSAFNAWEESYTSSVRTRHCGAVTASSWMSRPNHPHNGNRPLKDEKATVNSERRLTKAIISHKIVAIL